VPLAQEGSREREPKAAGGSGDDADEHARQARSARVPTTMGNWS
jgi:hypothetical protein